MYLVHIFASCVLPPEAGCPKRLCWWEGFSAVPAFLLVYMVALFSVLPTVVAFGLSSCWVVGFCHSVTLCAQRATKWRSSVISCLGGLRWVNGRPWLALHAVWVQSCYHPQSSLPFSKGASRKQEASTARAFYGSGSRLP